MRPVVDERRRLLRRLPLGPESIIATRVGLTAAASTFRPDSSPNLCASTRTLLGAPLEHPTDASNDDLRTSRDARDPSGLLSSPQEAGATSL